MQKDVLYIDVEDDITAIISKIKNSSHKIIALVPPKRVGVLQSAVNLRLANRAAEQNGKRLVLITGNQALAGLAATASIPVAKNLQSKPEMAEIAALEVDDGDDVIDGADLPVGEHARQAVPPADSDESADAVAAAGLSSAAEVRKAKPPAKSSAVKPKVKKGRVPNFDIFRKRLVLIVAGVLLLVGFLVWAIVFAPRANVKVSTRTTDAAVSQQVTLSASAESSAKNNIVKAITRDKKDEISIEFTATAEKEVGERATGTVDLSNRSRNSKTLAAGTEFRTDNGLVFTTNSSVVVPAATLDFDCDGLLCPGTASVAVTASERGSKYNAASGSLSGGGSGVSASFADATSGGTDKTVKVVSRGDVDNARQKAMGEIDEKAAVSQLKSDLGDGYIVLDDAVQVDSGKLKSSVGVGQEASGGKANYGGVVTYTLYAVAKSELDDYLKAVLENQIDDKDAQRVYESGASEAVFTNTDKSTEGLRATLSTNGKIGPKIDENQVKETVAGKRIGDIKSELEKIEGIDSVDIKLSPFWVNTAPKDLKKINVEFELHD